MYLFLYIIAVVLAEEPEWNYIQCVTTTARISTLAHPLELSVDTSEQFGFWILLEVAHMTWRLGGSWPCRPSPLFVHDHTQLVSIRGGSPIP